MLHQLLSANRDEIIARCAQRLRSRHPDRPIDELLDTIPGFLDELIKTERRAAGIPEATSVPEHSEHARAHGEQRYRKAYPIAELAIDFGTISNSIGEIAMEQEVDLDPKSYKLLNESIDNAIAEAITEYFELSRVSGEQEVVEWVGTLGHELRNAVASALMAYTALRSGQVGMESRTSRVLERSLHRIETLVGQTLAEATLRSGQALQRDIINIRELVDDVVAGTLVDREITITVDISRDTTVVADPTLLESALGNLIQNAVKYTRSNGQIQIRAVADARGTTIEVADECGGLGGKDPDELFSAFVRGSRERSGVGLGLAITRKSIEAHGGTVTVRDRAPIGCVFSLRLPNGGNGY